MTFANIGTVGLRELAAILGTVVLLFGIPLLIRWLMMEGRASRE